MVLPYGEIGSRMLDYVARLYANSAGNNAEHLTKFSTPPVILAVTLAVSLYILRMKRK